MLSIPSVSGSIPFESKTLGILFVSTFCIKYSATEPQDAMGCLLCLHYLLSCTHLSNRLISTPGSMNLEFPLALSCCSSCCHVTSLLFHGLLVLQTMCRNLTCFLQLQALVQWADLVLKCNIMKYYWDPKLLWLLKKPLVPHVF